MKITVDYDRSGIEVDVPDKNLSAVLTMNTIRALENPTLSVKDALSRPIAGPSLDRIAKGLPENITLLVAT